MSSNSLYVKIIFDNYTHMQDQSTTISGLLKPTPCSFVWKNNILTKGSFDHAKTCDLSESLSFEAAVAEFSKEEDFITHLKIAEIASKEKNPAFSKENYLKSLGYGNLELISSLSRMIFELPEDFKMWCKSKKLGPKDFRVMMSDFNKLDDSKAFSKIADLNPSKNNGLLIVEYYFDLKASKQIEGSYLNTFKNADNLLSALKKKRFSKSLKADESLSDRISKLQMAKGVNLNLKRVGDKRLLKLEAQVSSPEELKAALEKTLLKLVDVEKTWSDQI